MPETSESHSSVEDWLRTAAALPRTRAWLPGKVLGRGRFVIQRCLGEGGMGVVHAAYDQQLQTAVALKTLTDASPSRIYHLKNEFRALSDVRHPHLVRLHELHAEDGQFFVTMELVDGCDFVAAASGAPPAVQRSLLSQLASGIEAIHAAGKLHRDLKPSNVLVTPRGRVVIVDFGLVSDQARGGVGLTMAEDARAGTPEYMAPEQKLGHAPSRASDWYAFGRMLQRVLDEQAAPELRALRDALLQPLAAMRAGAEQVRALLGLPASAPVSAGLASGRDRELSQLMAAYERTRAGRAEALLLLGDSGIGKTTLAAAFLARLARAAEAPLVLSARCYQRDHVPYKALDPIMDSVSRYLRTLPDERASALLPRDTPELVRLFPALARVPAVARARGQRESTALADASEQRRRAFVACRALLAALAERQPLVLLIDDLQWGDDDSAKLLSQLLAPADAPALLFVACAHDSPDSLNSPVVQAAQAARCTRVYLGPLDETAIARLIEQRLRRPCPAALVAQVARESHGNPFLAQELADALAAHGGNDLSLARALEDKLASLPRAEVALLERLALAARPLPPSVLSHGLDAAASDPWHARKLLRARSSPQGEELEIVHERVAHTLRERMTQAERAAGYTALAAAFEQHRPNDVEAILDYQSAAGALERAQLRYCEAARRAAQALAFARAARLYERALACDPLSPSLRQQLWTELAEVHSHLGQCAQAAQAYLAAAELGDPDFELRCQAAHQYLIIGHVDAGTRLLEAVLSGLGMTYPSTPARAVTSLLLHRSLCWLRGSEPVPRARHEVSKRGVARLSALGAAAEGLSMTDNIRGADFGARYLWHALRTGERRHLARALGAEAAFLAREGQKHTRRVAELLESAHLVQSQLDDPQTASALETFTGMALLCEGQSRRGREHCQRALALLDEQPRAAPWQAATSRIFLAIARYNLGELRELASEIEVMLDAADSSGNLYLAASLCGVPGAAACLVRDDPEQAQRRLAWARERWTTSGYHLQRALLLLGECLVAAYRAEPARAFELLSRELPLLRRSQLTRIPSLYAPALHAYALSGLRSGMPLAEVDHTAELLRRQRIGSAAPLHAHVMAALALHRGDVERALEQLARSARGFDAVEMRAHACASRRAHGVLLGGEAGAAAVRAADRALGAHGSSVPERTARMLAPL